MLVPVSIVSRCLSADKKFRRRTLSPHANFFLSVSFCSTPYSVGSANDRETGRVSKTVENDARDLPRDFSVSPRCGNARLAWN